MCSDKPGSHNFNVLKKLVLPDGTILRARYAGRPARDCFQWSSPRWEEVIWSHQTITIFFFPFTLRVLIYRLTLMIFTIYYIGPLQSIEDMEFKQVLRSHWCVQLPQSRKVATNRRCSIWASLRIDTTASFRPCQPLRCRFAWRGYKWKLERRVCSIRILFRSHYHLVSVWNLWLHIPFSYNPILIWHKINILQVHFLWCQRKKILKSPWVF